MLFRSPTSDTSGHGVVVFDPEGEVIDQLSLDSATVGAYTFAFSGRSLAGVFADLRDGFAQQAATGTLTIDEPFTETTVSGLPAIKATFSLTETDGTRVIGSACYVVDKAFLYYIELDRTARPTDTAKAELEAILASFRPAP